MTGAALLQSVSDFDSGPFYNRSLLDCAGIGLVGTDTSSMNSQMNKDFESDYLDLPSQGHDIRYDQNTNGSLTIDGTAQTAPGLINHLFHPPVLNPTTSYSPDASSYYPTHAQLYSTLEVRPPRLGSTNPTPTVMSQPSRYAALPHPGSQISTRDQYSSATPSFRRPSEHPQRSPSTFPAPLRRHPLSPTPSPITNFNHTVRMDAGQYSKGQTVPPLMSMVTLGSLQYTDAGQPVPIKVDIQGNIDKGFFEADGDWTCYRRNYFSCVCSYSLSPWLPSSSIQFVQSGGQTYTVLDFYMCISAVVAENDSQKIELVQHTPKRDKGPTEEPKKIRMQPKTLQHHSMFSHDGGLGGSRMGYGAPDPYGNGQAGGECLTEHTFERIQFKQATANNGKRRAAQQYYHLVIELWANVGAQAPDSFVKVAYRKSAKMIVRGRSPGHYQGERHKSTSSGPGGGSTGMSGYPGGMMNADFGAPGGNMLGGGYGGGDYARNNNPYGGAQRHHHDLGLEPMMQTDDPKVLDSHKSAYLYFDGPISEATQHHHHQQHQHQQHQHHQHHNHGHQHQHQPDGRGTVDMFTHQSSNNGTGGRGGGAGAGVPPDGILPHMTTTTSTTLDSHREGVKRDPESGLLPSLFQPGPHSHRCSPFSAKTTSEGYYPSMMSQPGVSLT